MLLTNDNVMWIGFVNECNIFYYTIESATLQMYAVILKVHDGKFK